MNSDFKKGIEYLRKKQSIGKLINSIETPHFPIEKEYFKALIKYIIYQQLSIKSARKIYDRFLLLFNDTDFTPSNFRLINVNDLKNVGISKPKIKYMDCIANAFLEDDNFFKNINTLSNEEIINNLTKIKGIGPWTAEMFLMFSIQRLDIFSVKDLGIKKGMQKLFKLDNIPSDEFMIKKSKAWSPYRTIACLYLWKLVDENNFY